MKEIEEYLKSSDKSVVMIGYELLKGLNIHPEKKNKTMTECGFGTYYRLVQNKIWWRTRAYENRPIVWVAPFNWDL